MILWNVERPTKPGWYLFKGSCTEGKRISRLLITPTPIRLRIIWRDGGLMVENADQPALDQYDGIWAKLDEEM